MYGNQIYASCRVKILLIQVEGKSKKALKICIDLIRMKTFKYT